MTELVPGQVIRLADGRSAVVRFVGETAFAPGAWVGVELDDGSGKNDGSVQGERYFDCDMGNGMFVRPAAVAVIAQPPPKPKPAPTATRKTSTSRPSSMFTSGSRTASTSLDTGVGRRKSLNAPSPSPGPRTSRPSSIARVRILFPAYCVSSPLPVLISNNTAVTYQVPYKAARNRHVKRGHLPHRHPCKCTRDYDYQSTSRFSYDEIIYGPSRCSCIASRPPSIGLVCRSLPAHHNSKDCDRPAISDHRQSPARGLQTRLSGLTVRRGKAELYRQGCRVTEG